MRVAIFSTKSYDRVFLEAANAACGHELVFFEPRLTEETTALAAQYPAVCVFVNDQLSATLLSALAGQGTRLIALRSASPWPRQSNPAETAR
jgi:D-lactate dehydrogenase